MVANLDEFRFAQVDTGQIYLRHLTCGGEIDYGCQVKNPADVAPMAAKHRCPGSGQEFPSGTRVEVPCPGGGCSQYLYGMTHTHEIRIVTRQEDQ